MKSCRYCVKASLILLFLAVPAWAKPVTDQQIEMIAKDLRCLTCPNETIAESTTPMAMDVKHYIHDRLQAGDDKQTIIKTLTARYGEELRYKPLWVRHTWLLWLTPLLFLGLGGLVISRLFKGGAK